MKLRSASLTKLGKPSYIPALDMTAAPSSKSGVALIATTSCLAPRQTIMQPAPTRSLPAFLVNHLPTVDLQAFFADSASRSEYVQLLIT